MHMMSGLGMSFCHPLGGDTLMKAQKPGLSPAEDTESRVDQVDDAKDKLEILHTSFQNVVDSRKVSIQL